MPALLNNLMGIDLAFPLAISLGIVECILCVCCVCVCVCLLGILGVGVDVGVDVRDDNDDWNL